MSNVRSLAEALRVASGHAVDVLNASSTMDDWIPLDALSADAIASLYSGGGLSLRASDGCFALRVEWRLFESIHQLQRYLERSCYLQNSLLVTAAANCMQSLVVREAVMELARGVIAIVEPNYLIGLSDGARYDTDFSGRLGLGGGLRDVYPVNYFGGAFVELIGRKRLLSLPAEVIEDCGKGVFVLPLREYWVVGGQMDEARRRVRASLGEEHFAPSVPRQGGVEVGGLWAMVKAVWSERQRLSASATADKVPRFDWDDLVS